MFFANEFQKDFLQVLIFVNEAKRNILRLLLFRKICICPLSEEHTNLHMLVCIFTDTTSLLPTKT